MNFYRQKHLLILLIALALAGAGYLLWQNPVSEPGSGGSVGIEAYDEKGERTSDFTAKEIKLNPPDLDRPGKTSTEIKEISEILKGNYDYLQGWLQLGILRKQIGDYEGAIEAWNFAGVIRPNVATSFLNLADLYAYYLKDRPKAEKSFLDAIKAEPQNGFAYYQTANFYRDMLQNEGMARKILEQGISAGADPDGSLQLFLESF